MNEPVFYSDNFPVRWGKFHLGAARKRVTAHELAHQWWGHQITSNYTRGANLISEALAEFSALILTERKYGKDNMKRFLKDELDDYLRGRANGNKKENVFINCNRPYQWYNKGSLI